MTFSLDWELRRWRDGEIIDRATHYRVLRRAAWYSLKHYSVPNMRHLIVHVPTGRVVAERALHEWHIDEAAVAELESPGP